MDTNTNTKFCDFVEQIGLIVDVLPMLNLNKNGKKWVNLLLLILPMFMKILYKICDNLKTQQP